MPGYGLSVAAYSRQAVTRNTDLQPAVGRPAARPGVGYVIPLQFCWRLSYGRRSMQHEGTVSQRRERTSRLMRASAWPGAAQLCSVRSRLVALIAAFLGKARFAPGVCGGIFSGMSSLA